MAEEEAKVSDVNVEEEMEYKVGQKVNPIIQPNIVMLIDVIQITSCECERYHCYWFVDGEVRDGWFSSIELQPTMKNGNIGFKKEL